MKNEQNTMRDRFFRDGFILFEDVLDPLTVDRLRRFTDDVLARQAPEHFEENRTTGSMVMIDWAMACRNPVMAGLIAHPNALAALKTLGFEEPKFGHGRIISKPPHSPPLFWHEDGRFWNDPVSYSTQPIQCFLMYYLTDTTPHNGCLRVIPGSHLKRHWLHDRISPRHTEELRKFENPGDPGFSRVAEEVDVPVEAGDLVMGYGSLLHASHANRSNQRRTVLTMWYYPDFVSLPERTQATVALLETDNGDAASASAEIRALMEPLKIVYEGEAEPIETEWTPGEALN